MYHVNEKIVYPGHGVAIVNRVFEKIVAGQVTSFYELKFINKDMTVLVPMHGATNVGIRSLSSNEKIDDILKLLAEPVKKVHNYELTASNWNKRNKEYQNKLRTGNLKDISEIYRDLKCIAQHKELSFGEKNLLNQTEGLLAEEIAIVRKVNEEAALEVLRAVFNVVEKPVASFNQRTP